MIHLVVTLKGRTVGRFDVPGDRVGIGRHPDNEVQIDNRSVSRYHCVLQRDPHTRSWVASDQGSQNGTYVNGARSARCELKSGDTLGIGQFAVALQIDPEPGTGAFPAQGMGSQLISVRGSNDPAKREADAAEKGFLVLENRPGPELLLIRDLFQIGSAPGLDLHLPGPLKSALIVRGYGGFQLVNAGLPAHCVRMNDVDVPDRAWLPEGARLEVGPLQLAFYHGLPAEDQATMCIDLPKGLHPPEGFR